MTYERNCPMCGRGQSVELREGDLERWQNGELIQNVFTYLAAPEREILITGICRSCWKGLFGAEDTSGE